MTLPYELNVHASVDAPGGTVTLTFIDTGCAAAVFQVRSVNPADAVRDYTVEAGKTLNGTWTVGSSYHLSVYGPNGFIRFFNGSVGGGAAALDVKSRYEKEEGRGSIEWRIKNVATTRADVSILDAYTGM